MSNPQSNHKGVSWNKQSRKWIGTCCDVSVRANTGGAKLITTKCFVDDDACHEALNVLRAEIAIKNASLLEAMASELDLTRDLPARPQDPAEGKRGQAYYGPAGQKAPGADVYEFRPDRFVRRSAGKGKFIWQSCCQHGIGANACAHTSSQRAYGVPATHCLTHGGGCPHKREFTGCIVCDDNASKKAGNCSRCVGKELGKKKRLSAGGRGLCATCEADVDAEAAAVEAARTGIAVMALGYAAASSLAKVPSAPTSPEMWLNSSLPRATR